MNNLSTALILVLAFFSIGFADTTWIEAGDIEGVWDIDGSPYIMQREARLRIRENAELEILAGVEVFLDYDASIYSYENGSLVINGSAGAPAYFRPLRNGTSAHLGMHWGHMILRYCRFNRMIVDDNSEEYFIELLSDDRGFLMENCIIEESIGGLYLETPGIVRDCLFKDVEWAIDVRATSIFEKCVVWGEEFRIHAGAFDLDTIHFDHCAFKDYRVIRANGNIEIKNTIFINPRISYLLRSRNDSLDFGMVRYNCFLGDQDNAFYLSNGRLDTLTQLGKIDRLNRNGDSCDAYGNIFLDPRIVAEGDYPDYFFLTADSPCIDAGDPDSPLDPDSTIADIGPFFFSQPNIAVSADSFAFAETPVGSIDTLIFSIRNRGDQKDLRYFIDEEALGRSFWVLGWGGDMASLAAGESVELALIFRPEAPEEFLDTLRITSNDRDEGVIDLPIRGVAANSVVNDVEAGRMRRSVLLSVSPNPFNSTLTIKFSTSGDAYPTRLAVYDFSGREVARLVDGSSSVNPLRLTERSSADHRGSAEETNSVTWNASSVPAGVYLVRLQIDQDVSTRKVVLIR